MEEDKESANRYFASHRASHSGASKQTYVPGLVEVEAKDPVPNSVRALFWGRMNGEPASDIHQHPWTTRTRCDTFFSQTA